MGAEAIIETQALTKRFGSLVAVKEVSLEVPAGVAFGFLGPNGAGKTTLIRMLLGLARATSGTARVRGFEMPAGAIRALERVGGIVEEPRFYHYMTGRQNLEAWAALIGGDARGRIPSLLARVKLEARGDEKVKRYSAGMRQRLGVARALLGDPELLILDEPTNGLDPAGMAEFRDVVRELVDGEGRTVFISSHLLDEIQKMCDHVAIVDHGVVVMQGSVRELIEGGETGITVDCDEPARARGLLEELDGVRGVTEQRGGLLFVDVQATREAAIAINRALVEGGIGVAGIAKSEQTLEQRYLELTAGSTPSSGPAV